MTDTEYDEITFDEAIRFMRGISEDISCSVCKETKWDIPVTDEDEDLVILAKSGLHLSDGERLTLEITCRHCGFIRCHDEYKVKQWLKNNPVQGSDDNE